MAERFDLGVAEAVNGAGVRVGIRCSAYTTPREFVSRAFLYNRQGQYEKALEYYQKDLDITIRVVGHQHKDVATTNHNIAEVKEAQGDLDEARSLFLECEQIYGVLHNHEIENPMNHYPMYPSSHAACACVRARGLVCVCVTLRVRPWPRVTWALATCTSVRESMNRRLFSTRKRSRRS